MPYQVIKNVEIAGIAASVPSFTEENSELSLFQSAEDYRKFVTSTGVERRRIATNGLCASDLCFAAAEQLISRLNWNKKDIDCLIFVSHSPDYKFPATSCILQWRLGLPESCMCFDMSLGCSGWVYGLSTIASLVSAGKFKKAILLAGDTTSFSKSRKDKGTYPLFGDSGSATALQYKDNTDDILAHTATAGKNYDAIIMEDGGYRNQVSTDSFTEREYEDGAIRNRLHTRMDGMTVFSFGISKVPKSISEFFSHFDIDRNSIDYFIFHQANLMINQRIQKKLGIPDDKVPNVFKNFGNTSSGSIPLTMVVNLNDEINGSSESKLTLFACGFGVGLSWGSVQFTLENAVCCELIEI